MFIMSFLSFFSFLFTSPAPTDTQLPKSIYEFQVAGLEGGMINFSDFKGKKILIVNTASKCGHTPQYAELETLYQQHGNKLVIVGFPANNFMFQEPGSNEEIATFCEKNYGVTFPMAAKISVKGKDMAPIYQWLTNKDHNHFKNSSVKWNFQKYLIDEKGNLIDIFSPSTKPLSEEVLAAIAR